MKYIERIKFLDLDKELFVRTTILFWILTFNLLNYPKDYKTYIHILNRILDPGWTQVDEINSRTKIHVCPTHVCWCSGDFRSRSISRHGIDSQSRNIPSPTSEELIAMKLMAGSDCPQNIFWNWSVSKSMLIYREQIHGIRCNKFGDFYTLICH